eukprot:3258938-Rhodomonas_salina.2
MHLDYSIHPVTKKVPFRYQYQCYWATRVLCDVRDGKRLCPTTELRSAALRCTTKTNRAQIVLGVCFLAADCEVSAVPGAPRQPYRLHEPVAAYHIGLCARYATSGTDGTYRTVYLYGMQSLVLWFVLITSALVLTEPVVLSDGAVWCVWY